MIDNNKFIYTISRWLTLFIDINRCDDEISTEHIRNFLCDIFDHIDVDNINDEKFQPINTAIEIFELAKEYMINHPVHNDWITKPENLDSYWTWEACLREARWKLITSGCSDGISCNHVIEE